MLDGNLESYFQQPFRDKQTIGFIAQGLNVLGKAGLDLNDQVRRYPELNSERAAPKAQKSDRSHVVL